MNPRIRRSCENSVYVCHLYPVASMQPSSYTFTLRAHRGISMQRPECNTVGNIKTDRYKALWTPTRFGAGLRAYVEVEHSTIADV